MEGGDAQSKIISSRNCCVIPAVLPLLLAAPGPTAVVQSATGPGSMTDLSTHGLLLLLLLLRRRVVEGCSVWQTPRAAAVYSMVAIDAAAADDDGVAAAES